MRSEVIETVRATSEGKPRGKGPKEKTRTKVVEEDLTTLGVKNSREVVLDGDKGQG